MNKYKFDEIAISCTAKKKPVEEDKYNYIGLEHLVPGTFKVDKYGSEIAPKGEKLIMHKGDVLFGKRRAYQKKVGIAPCDGIFSAHGMVLQPKEEVICKEFFPFFIASDYFLNRCIRISVGSLSPTVNWGDLKNEEFYLPDMETQKKLAELLWAMNNVKEAYNSLIKQGEEFKISFIKNEMNNPEFEIKKIGDLTDIKTGKLDANASCENGIYPFFSCAAEPLKIDNYAYDCECVLVAGNGELNVKYYKGKFNAYQRTYIICSNTDKLNVEYLFYFLEMYLEKLKNETVGSVIKYIKLSNLTDAEIPLPIVEKQIEIVKKIKDQNKLIENAKYKKNNIINMIKSLLNDYLENNKNEKEEALE